MPDDVTTAEAPELETPSTEGAPEETEVETPSTDVETEDAPPDETSDAEPPQAEEADDDDVDPQDEAWLNFKKKFDKIKDPRERKAAMGRAYWEKTRYAAEVRRERDALRDELEGRTGKADEEPKDAPPAQPHPDIAKLDQRIQGLVQKDQSLIQNQTELLQVLRGVDEEIIKYKTKAEDADEYNKALFEQKAETAAVRKATLLQRWADINDRREQLSYDVERLMSDRNWVEQFVRQEEQRKSTEAQSLKEFNQSFPRFVDSTIQEVANELGAPEVKGLREDLRATVRDKLTVALWKMSKTQVEDVDVPEMVRGYVESYLKRNELVGRTKFTEKSAKKLAVAGKAVPPKPAGAPPPRDPSKPMRPSQMNQGELSPSMLRARQYLASKGL